MLNINKGFESMIPKALPEPEEVKPRVKEFSITMTIFGYVLSFTFTFGRNDD